MSAHRLPQQPHVSLLYVPPIFSQMHCNAIGTSEFCQHRCCHGIWLHRPPCLSNRGNVVYIDAKRKQPLTSPYAKNRTIYILAEP
jgi:hypothetical protein